MSANPFVIVGCGAGKLDHPAPAAALYTGQHFRLALRAGLALTPAPLVVILSARYGLVDLDTSLAPYDLTLGQPGAVTADLVAGQAAIRGVDGGRPVVVLASRRYADLCAAVWPNLTRPLAGLGIGRQRAALARMVATGAVQ